MTMTGHPEDYTVLQLTTRYFHIDRVWFREAWILDAGATRPRYVGLPAEWADAL